MEFCNSREWIHVAGFGVVPYRGRNRGAEERLEPESQHSVSYPDRRGSREIFPLSNSERPIQKGEETGRRYGDRHWGLAGSSRLFTTKGLYRGPWGIPNTEVNQNKRPRSLIDNKEFRTRIQTHNNIFKRTHRRYRFRSKMVYVGKDRPIQDAVQESKKVPAQTGVLARPRRPPNPFRYRTAEIGKLTEMDQVLIRKRYIAQKIMRSGRKRK